MERDYAPSLNAPLLRVSRPVSACSRCRSAKVKCDGKLPACSACERSGKAHECTGGSDQFARGKERSYVASLESRIERLEKRLAVMAQRRGSVAMIDMSGAGLGQGEEEDRREDMSPPKTAQSRKQKKEEAGDIEGIISDFGYLTINATTRDFYKNVTRMSFAKIVLTASSVSKALSAIPHLPLPPRNIAAQFIQHYFDKIFPLTPCLSETSFYISLDLVYKNSSQASNFDRFIVYMVLAVGTMSLSRERNSRASVNAASFVKTALDYAEDVISTAGVSGIQATLLLLQYSTLEPSHFNSWYLIGVASRIAIDIGLHQETPASVLKLPAAELDLRRRIFYCVYAYDRAISMVLQRPFSFSDDSVSVLLPRSIENSSTRASEEADSWRGTLVPKSAARHLFKLRKLQSSWYQLFYHTGDDPLPLHEAESYTSHRRSELESWFSSMPDSALSPVIKDWLTLEYHYIQVYLSAPCPKIPNPSDASWKAIFTHAVAYAVRFADILSDENHRIVYTYHDGLRTYYVGSNLLHAIWAREELVLGNSTSSSSGSATHGNENVKTEKDTTTTTTATTKINTNATIQATDAIKAIISILSAMVKRWDNAGSLVEKFTSESEFMLARLEKRIMKQRAREAQQIQQQQQQQQQQRMDRMDRLERFEERDGDGDGYYGRLQQGGHPPSVPQHQQPHTSSHADHPPALPPQHHPPHPPPAPLDFGESSWTSVDTFTSQPSLTDGGGGGGGGGDESSPEHMDSVVFGHLNTVEFGNVAFYHSLGPVVGGGGGY